MVGAGLAFHEHSEDGEMDETLALYWEKKQMEDEEDFAQFCLAKDQGFPEN